MALLNLLCVDKTGTLTSDEVTLDAVVSFGRLSERSVGQWAALVAQETSGGNATGAAILAGVDVPKATVREVLAFSSVRKLAGVSAAVGGTMRTVVMGAPEFVAQLAVVDQATQATLDGWASEGLRVLLLAEFDEDAKLKKLADGSGRVIGAVVLRNSLREGVPETVNFLQDRGVSIRVISGDNPLTVQHIARTAGIKHPSRAITGAELATMSDEEFTEATKHYTIFARVLPEQKERLIAEFRRQGLFTGMVGDGVNDALALKQADLGIAMYAGAPASRRVADFDFAE